MNNLYFNYHHSTTTKNSRTIFWHLERQPHVLPLVTEPWTLNRDLTSFGHVLRQGIHWAGASPQNRQSFITVVAHVRCDQQIPLLGTCGFPWQAPRDFNEPPLGAACSGRLMMVNYENHVVEMSRVYPSCTGRKITFMENVIHIVCLSSVRRSAEWERRQIETEQDGWMATISSGSIWTRIFGWLVLRLGIQRNDRPTDRVNHGPTLLLLGTPILGQ